MRAQKKMTDDCVCTASRLAQVVLGSRQTKAKVVLLQTVQSKVLQTLQSLSTCCCATGASPLFPQPSSPSSPSSLLPFIQEIFWNVQSSETSLLVYLSYPAFDFTNIISNTKCTYLTKLNPCTLHELSTKDFAQIGFQFFSD